MGISVDFRQNRFVQIFIAMVTMMMISVYEYTFTLFEQPIGKYYHWSEPGVAAIFTIYMVVESFAMMLGGWLSDRYGPRWVATIGGVLSGAGWIAAAHVSSLGLLYIVYAVGSIGPGFVYAASVGTTVKWFPVSGRTRGLAMGFVTGAFGAGSALFIPRIAKIIHHAPGGFIHAFQMFGIVQLLVIAVVAQLMASPTSVGRVVSAAESAERQFTPKTMLRTRQFWLLWIIFVVVVGAGQMTVAHLASVGASFKIAAATMVGIIATSRIFNGLGRIVIGGLSDRIGRERSMALFFSLMALCLYGSTMARHNPMWFGVLSVATLFFWGPIFTLVPATIADYFGAHNASYNYGVMSTGKALGGLYAGYVSGLLFVYLHGWATVLKVNAVLVLAGALIAIVLKSPQRRVNSAAVSADGPPMPEVEG